MPENRASRRASGAKYPTLDQWSHQRVIKGLALPAVKGQPALMVDYEIPDMWALGSDGELPNPLAAMALKIEQGVMNTDDFSDEEHQTYYELACNVIARHLRKPDLVAELGELEAVEWVKTKLHPDHRDALWARSIHVFQPADFEEVLRSITALEKSGDGNDGPQAVESGAQAV